MTLWLSLPHDPLIFRDGRPFTAAPGAEAISLPFPFPSTIAGAVRTRAGTDPVTNEFQKEKLPKLMENKIFGPLLVEVDPALDKLKWLFPAPADALLLRLKNDVKDENWVRSKDDTKEENWARRFCLRPISIENLHSGETDLSGLHLVGPSEYIKDKPHPSPPAFWTENFFMNWLIEPSDDSVDNPVDVSVLGQEGPQQENRLHPAIDSATQAARTGYLFRTSGLEFYAVKKDHSKTKPQISRVRPLGIVVQTDAELQPMTGFMGGERRIVSWIKRPESLPSIPEKLKEKIRNDKACRLILLTPAVFNQGHIPSFEFLTKEKPEIVAAAVRRYHTVSGWDYKDKESKPTKRLAPAGSVYFLRLNPNIGDEGIDEFIEETWMKNTSDDPQERRDGFGLAVLGSWDGDPGTMEVKSE